MSNTIIERRNGHYYLTDNDVEVELSEITKDGLSLILPENASGRKFFALKKFDRAERQELNAINRAPSDGESTPRKSLTDYMTPEDRIIYDQIMERCKKARDEAHRPMTEEEKLRARLKKLQAQLEALTANNAEEEEA